LITSQHEFLAIRFEGKGKVHVHQSLDLAVVVVVVVVRGLVVG
jgi:hypothetical protein